MTSAKAVFTTTCTGILTGLALLLTSCENTGVGPSDTWDRAAMLEHQTSHFIVPAFQAYSDAAAHLDEAASAFATTADQAHFDALEDALLSAYIAWQSVSFIEVGSSESVALRYRTNTYPTDTATVLTTAMQYTGNSAPNFELPSTYDQQGLPALDYLIHGKTLAELQSSTEIAGYIARLATEVATLAQTAANDWATQAESFASDAGTSASAPTNKLANDFVFHFEKELRAGKVGIPAGVFSSVTFPEKVEARYSGDSKALFLASLRAHQMFFSGTAYDSLSTGPSFAGYLDHLDIKEGTVMLSDRIIGTFEGARSLAAAIDTTFEEQTRDDAMRMLELYDELQRGVVLAKVDMMQAMNIKVDYVDADGD